MKLIEPPFFGFIMETSSTLSLTPYINPSFTEHELLIMKDSAGPILHELGSVMWLRGISYDLIG